MRSEIESELAGVPRLPSSAAHWRGRLLLPLAFIGGLASLGIEFAAARIAPPDRNARPAITSGTSR